jgi:hypothetical protein
MNNPVWEMEALPPNIEAHLREAYAAARVILEYGSGGSTLMAAAMPGKFILSVESDRAWAVRLQLRLDTEATASPAIVYPVDIGETGRWGRPMDGTSWQRFHRYPLAIWDEPFFRHPDVILIDGRFRPACLMTAALRIERPVTVLFDDYAKRPQYHMVEDLVRPVRRIGRMAEFRLEPGAVTGEAASLLMASFAQASYAARPAPDLKVPAATQEPAPEA